MAESGVILPVDSTGKALRTATQSTSFAGGSDGFVHQQVVTLGDPATPANLATVTSAGALQVIVPDAYSTGSLAILNDYFAVASTGRAEVAFQLTGTWVGAVSFQGTVSSTGISPSSAWVPISATAPSSSSAPITSTTSNGIYVVRVSGYTAVRVTTTAYTSGTVTVWANASTASTTVALGDPVAAPAITKGTQGATGFAVQDLKDSGRTGFALAAIAAAGVTTEALLSTVAQRNGAASGSATTQTVTAGKTLRIQNITVSMRLGAAAAGWSRFVLRSTYSATAATATSPALWAAEIGPGAAAVSASTATMTYDFPDGIELPAGSSFALSHISSATTNVETITITGFEY